MASPTTSRATVEPDPGVPNGPRRGGLVWPASEGEGPIRRGCGKFLNAR